jgi:hypothetical protein
MKKLTIRQALFVALTIPASVSFASTTLTADGSDTYQLIKSKLNSEIEAPDCAHPDFGKHITQDFDSALNKQVFVFHSHVKPDNDRCLKSDRQRNEIKVDANSPSALKASNGDKMQYRWKFKLDSGFLTSPDFSHLHQIKPVGGDDDNPLITIIARNTSMELTHYNYSNSRKVLKSVPLSGFLGEWVEVNEKVTMGRPGTYSVAITRVRDGATLLSYSSASIDMWRSGNTYVRPKWGLYRSLNRSSYLRDEKVRFDQFCIAKGSDTCGGGSGTTPQVDAPDFSVAAGAYAGPQTVAMKSATADASIRYTTGTTAPTCSSGTAYSAPLTVASTTTLKAIACKSGMSASAVASATYTIGSAPAKLPASSIVISASANDGNVPANTLDGSLSTRWSAEGDGQWIQYDLKAAKTVSRIKLAWHNGSSRKTGFDIQVSADGRSFTTVMSGQSSGTTTALENYDFTDVTARYVRIVGHGNSANDWNSITETELYGLQ